MPKNIADLLKLENENKADGIKKLFRLKRNKR